MSILFSSKSLGKLVALIIFNTVSSITLTFYLNCCRYMISTGAFLTLSYRLRVHSYFSFRGMHWTALMRLSSDRGVDWNYWDMRSR